MHADEVRKNSFVARMMFVDRGLPNKTVLDVGCGPLSLLLRVPVQKGSALDPLVFDDMESEYAERGIQRIIKPAEDLTPEDGQWDEAWVYNCLQHVQNPRKILKNTMRVAQTVRVFEWVNIPPYQGHLHELKPDTLRAPFLQGGWHKIMETTGNLAHSGLYGEYFMGIYSRQLRDEL